MAADDITIKEYLDKCVIGVDRSIAELRAYMEQHFAMNDKALTLANESILARLETMNEFRTQINKERLDYVTKEMMTVQLANVDKRLKDLEMAKAFSAGKAYAVMAIFAAIPTILALIALFTK